jgi:amidophosphoribosyltransferase
LNFYKEKYGSAFTEYKKCISYGKSNNRGQDGAGFTKLDVEPGERYISRAFNNAQPIQDVFAQINDRINEEMAAHPEYADDVPAQKQIFLY